MKNNKVADKEELLKILDKNGNCTNQFEKRSVVHKNGLFHQEVAFIPINNQGQILLQRRSKNKKSYPNCWALCAGHVVGNQTSLEAVKMEANEELGLSLTEKDFIILVENTKNIRDDNKCYATCYYKIIDKPISFFSKQDEEVEELKWFDIKDFEKLVKSEQNCIFKNNSYYKLIISNLKSIIKKHI